jgi:hypothetical protein
MIKHINQIEDDYPDLLAVAFRRPSKSSLVGLGIAGLVGSAVLDRVIRRKIWGPAVSIWGPLFIAIGLYRKVTRLERELVKVKSGSLH